MPSDHRERNFENALASHLRAGNPAPRPHGACPDPETLAAYHERSLAPAEIAATQAHIATCDRCQQVLALLQETEEIPAPLTSIPASAAVSDVRVFPARRPAIWRWAAPAGAIAAALLVWISIHESNTPLSGPQTRGSDAKQETKQPAIAKDQSVSSPLSTAQPSLDATRQREAARTYAPDATPTAPAPKSPAQPLLKERLSADARKKISPAGAFDQFAENSPNQVQSPLQSDRKDLSPGAMSETVTVEAEKADSAKNEVAKSEPKQADDKRGAPSLLARAQAPAAGVVGAVTGGAAAAKPAPGPATANTPAPPPAVPSVAQTVEVTSEAAAVSTLPTQGRDSSMSVNLNAAQVLAVTSVTAVTVSAPDGRAAWRIGPAGVVEFSSNAEKTWLVQPSGVIADLLAGSAPSDRVCWLVGRAGTILRTTDSGKHWRRVEPPAPDDFKSVFAVNARQATVSATNGSYQTTDGGATWKKLLPE